MMKVLANGKLTVCFPVNDNVGYNPSLITWLFLSLRKER